MSRWRQSGRQQMLQRDFVITYDYTAGMSTRQAVAEKQHMIQRHLARALADLSKWIIENPGKPIVLYSGVVDHPLMGDYVRSSIVLTFAEVELEDRTDR